MHCAQDKCIRYLQGITGYRRESEGGIRLVLPTYRADIDRELDAFMVPVWTDISGMVGPIWVVVPGERKGEGAAKVGLSSYVTYPACFLQDSVGILFLYICISGCHGTSAEAPIHLQSPRGVL